MKTVRTVLATLAGVLLAYSLTAWISVRADAAFVQRTIYQGFDQTFIIALVMGGAFLLITVILSVAIASASAEGEDFEEDEEDEEPLEDEEEELPKPAPKKSADKGAGYRRPAHMPQKNLEEVLEEEQIVFAKPAQPEVKPEPKPEPAPEAKPEPVSEVKPEVKPEPEPVPEVKPAPKPQEEGFIHCIYCGKKVSANSAFCPQCGKKL